MSAKLLISLDYELFFGRNAGTVDKCMIEPVEALLGVVERYGVRLVLFVDAGFVFKLKEEGAKHASLGRDYDKIRTQLQHLKERGHDIQLHIHPHWEDCFFDGEQWVIDTGRYKLQDFSSNDIEDIVSKYKRALTDIVGDSVFAYRAGGWCIQPFSAISGALENNGIWLDSTAYHQGISDDPQRWFDFSQAPAEAWWRFAHDPAEACSDGRFVEIPISACKISPLFFWRMLVIKKMEGSDHRAFGDGASMTYGYKYYIDRLTRPTSSVVSVDGLKSAFLGKAYRQFRAAGGEIFNVMGHPKALTPYALRQLDTFLSNRSELESVTFQDFKHLQ